MLLPTTPKTQSGASAGAIHWLQPDQQYYDTGSVSWKNVDTAAAGSGNSSLDTSQDWTVGLDGWTASAGNTHLSNSASVVAIVDPLYPNIYLPSTQAKLIRTSLPSCMANISILSCYFSRRRYWGHCRLLEPINPRRTVPGVHCSVQRSVQFLPDGRRPELRLEYRPACQQAK